MQVMSNLRSTDNPKTLCLTQLPLKTPVSALSCFLSQAGQKHHLKSLSPAFLWHRRRDSDPKLWWELAHRPQEKDRVWILPTKSKINNFITPRRLSQERMAVYSVLCSAWSRPPKKKWLFALLSILHSGCLQALQTTKMHGDHLCFWE